MMKFISTVVLSAALAGCAALDSLQDNPGAAKLPVQYATLKVIESDEVTRADVLSHVERARNVLTATEEVSVTDLTATVDLSGLDAADRLLVASLLSQIEYAANDVDVVGEARRVRLKTLLDWIEQAAGYADQNS